MELSEDLKEYIKTHGELIEKANNVFDVNSTECKVILDLLETKQNTTTKKSKKNGK